MKTGSSQPARWSTTQRKTSVSTDYKLGAQELLRRLDELLRVERLADERLCAPLGRGLGRSLVDLAAEHDHGDGVDAVALADATQHLPAVHLGHHHVEEDEIRRLLVEGSETLLRVRGLADRIALHLQVDADELTQPLVVVDDQDRPLPAVGSPLRRRRCAARLREESVQVATAIPAVAARRVEGRDAPAVRPLADRALRHTEMLGRLAERQPVRLAG